MTKPTKAPTERQRIGRMGEDATLRRYTDIGYTLVARNLHLSHNELDLIVQNETSLVFVEVKTRHALVGVHSPYGRPASSVRKGKQSRTVEAAKTYLREHPTTLQPRIDVAEVYVSRHADGREEITHIHIIRNAFGA